MQHNRALTQGRVEGIKASPVPGCAHASQEAETATTLRPGIFTQRDAQKVPESMLTQRRFVREGRCDRSWGFRAGSGPGASCKDAGVDSGKFSGVPLCFLDLAPTYAAKTSTSST